VQEPEREEGDREAPMIVLETGAPVLASVAEPKAYAFDGWGMVPLELDLV
jgi:hypothetical protein